jgi:hypothetical protein
MVKPLTSNGGGHVESTIRDLCREDDFLLFQLLMWNCL